MKCIPIAMLIFLVGAQPAYGQVAVDFSASTGRGVNTNTVRLTGTLATPAPCCAPGEYTADFQWDPFGLVLVPVAIVTGPTGPSLPNLTGTYNLSLTATQTCTNPSFNGTFLGSGLIRFTQRGDSVRGFGGVFFPVTGNIDGVGVEMVVTPTGATGQIQILTEQAILGTATVTSTVGSSTLNLGFSGNFPTVGCQFIGAGVAAQVTP